MKNFSFISDVLKDLSEFAKENSMAELEKAIDEAQRVALIEIVHAKEETNYQAVMSVVFPERKTVERYAASQRQP